MDTTGAAGGDRRRNRTRPTLPGDAIRVAPVLPVPGVLRDHGVDPRGVLARVGLDARLLEDPDNRVSFDLLGRFLDASVAATGCQHLGLLVGRRFSPATIGVVFELMRHSRSLRDALRALSLHLHVHDRGGVSYLVHSGDQEVGLAYGIYRHCDFELAPLHDLATAVGFAMLRELCGPTWRPLRVTFPYRRPAGIAAWRRVFGAPLVFNAEHASVVFEERWLDEPIRGADPAVCATLERLVAEKAAAETLSLADRVRRVLRSMTLAGTASAEQVAFLFATSRRTLHRQLQAEGTSLQRLLNETRLEIARQLLHESDMPAGDIAAVLHYADASAFSRAFRNWSGTSPRACRQAVKAAATPAHGRNGPRGSRRRRAPSPTGAGGSDTRPKPASAAARSRAAAAPGVLRGPRERG